jgi:2-methylfumaryl-CoA hydratase
LALDGHLSEAVTGRPGLASPSLVCNVAIGQTTYASQRVKGNLFYRGLVLRRPCFLGDTLRTSTKVVALKQNRIKPGRAATGMVALEMSVLNQRGEQVLRFWRCPMIPCRDADADTGLRDSFDSIPEQLDPAQLAAALPSEWRLEAFRAAAAGDHFADIDPGARYRLAARDSVTCAPELVRMTLNMASTHCDPGASAYGKRLVYGGHTISMAAAHLSRVFPNLLTIVGWRRCDHTAPVFEGDVLRSEVTVTGKRPLDAGGLLELAVQVFAERGSEAPPELAEEPETQVLDWDVVAAMA